MLYNNTKQKSRRTDVLKTLCPAWCTNTTPIRFPGADERIIPHFFPFRKYHFYIFCRNFRFFVVRKRAAGVLRRSIHRSAWKRPSLCGKALFFPLSLAKGAGDKAPRFKSARAVAWLFPSNSPKKACNPHFSLDRMPPVLYNNTK